MSNSTMNYVHDSSEDKTNVLPLAKMIDFKIKWKIACPIAHSVVAVWEIEALPRYEITDGGIEFRTIETRINPRKNIKSPTKMPASYWISRPRTTAVNPIKNKFNTKTIMEHEGWEKQNEMQRLPLIFLATKKISRCFFYFILKHNAIAFV